MAFGDKRPRDYFKTCDFKQGDELLFITDAGWVEQDFSPEQDGSEKKNVCKAKVRLNGGEIKDLTINATSGKELSKKWGDEGEGNWKGKTAIVNFVKMASFGEVKDVLALQPKDE